MNNRNSICVDYDAMGNFSRFPTAQNQVKTDLVLWKFFRIFVSNKSKNPTKNRVS